MRSVKRIAKAISLSDSPWLVEDGTHEAAIPQTPRWGFWQGVERGLIALLAMYGAAALVALLVVPRYFLPAEDVVILYQYSHNLALHGAITYYAGGPHAEGATDFGWMLLVAGAIRLGIPPFVFSAVTNFCALPLLAIVLLQIARVGRTLPRILAVCGAAAMLPQIIAAGSGFAVLPDALLLSLLVLAVVRRRSAAAALLALALCLFRPDGVVFAVPLLLALLLEKADRRRRGMAIVLGFVVPGLVYFVWRAHYFGALFPLPFTVKSDVHRVLGAFVPRSFRRSCKYLLFDAVFLMPLARRLLSPATRLLFPGIVLVPTLFYWAMRLDQNVADRFFFYLPLAAALLVALHWATLNPLRHRQLLYTGFAALIVLIVPPLLREIRTFRDYQFQDIEGIARGLSHSSTRGSLLSTEAGFLAYGSGWVAYDAWGLNTWQFAKHLIQPADVVALRPDLIVLHPDLSESCLPQPGWPAAYSGRTWQHMTRNLVLGAQRAGDYQLWLLSYGSDFYRRRMGWTYGQGDRECFLVRRDSPRFAEMVATLRAHHAAGPPQSLLLEQSRIQR